MKQIKQKNVLWILLVFTGMYFTACKSKTKTDTTTETTTSIDTNRASAQSPEPVVVSPDASIQTGLIDATKDYPDVKATVANGEVTLTGNITRDKLPGLMQSVNSLQPKKINNNLTIK